MTKLDRLYGRNLRNWAPVVPRYSSRLPGYYYFPSRDSFDDFIAGLKKFDQGVSIVLKLDGRTSQQVTSADDLFAQTHRPVRFLSVSISDVSISFCNLFRQGYIEARAGNADTVSRAMSVQELASRFVRRLRWWNPLDWRRMWRRDIVTRIPASERRDVNWRIATATISAIVGGVLGFVGGLLARIIVPS